MLGIAVLLLAVCLGAAVVGTVVTGLFSLALISLALLLGAGAVGLTLQRPRGAEANSLPAEQEAAVIPLGPRHRPQGGGGVSRAA